jgi:hypothetical protein
LSLARHCSTLFKSVAAEDNPPPQVAKMYWATWHRLLLEKKRKRDRSLSRAFSHWLVLSF